MILHMYLFKQKYAELRYSEEQEAVLKEALTPIRSVALPIRSVATSAPTS